MAEEEAQMPQDPAAGGDAAAGADAAAGGEGAAEEKPAKKRPAAKRGREKGTSSGMFPTFGSCS